jgi:DNA-binding PadR family transcriptional regulator
MTGPTEPTERVLRLVAFQPEDPPSAELLDDIVEDVGVRLLTELLDGLPEDVKSGIAQATLDELADLGLVETGPDGGYRITPAGEAALDRAAEQDSGPGGTVWILTLSSLGPGWPWVIDEMAEVTEAEANEAEAPSAEAAAGARS